MKEDDPLAWIEKAEEDWVTANLDILSGYAVGTRYPGAEPPLNDTRDALQTTKVIRRFARSFLGLKK